MEPIEVALFGPPLEPLLRRPTRGRHSSQKYYPREFLLLNNGGEPESYEEIMSHEKKDRS